MLTWIMKDINHTKINDPASVVTSVVLCTALAPCSVVAFMRVYKIHYRYRGYIQFTLYSCKHSLYSAIFSLIQSW